MRKEIEKGLPVYAECGGLMYLGETLVVAGNAYPMVGALPILFTLQKKPQGHGYTILEADQTNPYYPVGATIRGHEFHYSKAVIKEDQDLDFVFKISRGRGVDGKRDGVRWKKLNKQVWIPSDPQISNGRLGCIAG